MNSRLLITGLLLSLALLLNTQFTIAQEVENKIDQNTKRRITKTGLTAYNPQKTCPGYVVYCPSFGRGAVHLIDLNGKIIHEWELDYAPGLWGYLLPNGNLFYIGKSQTDHSDEIGPWWRNERGGLMMEIDWDNNIVWKHEDNMQHHDARRTQTGGAIYLTIERIPDEIAVQVKGGIPDSEGEHGMFADLLIEVDSTGKKIWEWHAYKYLDLEKDIINHGLKRHEWSHGNTIVPIGNDRVMVSFRGISVVAIIEKSTKEIVWKLNQETLSQQHDPSLLENGNILVFNNGTDRPDAFAPFSEVLEIDVDSELAWKYRDKPNWNLFSPHIGGAQRLPNGNTLIIEGWFGRMFQVTPDNELVWEFINDYSPIPGWSTEINSFFRARHYMKNEIPQLNKQ